MENFIRVYKDAYSAEYCKQVIDFFEHLRALGFGRTRQQSENATRHYKDDIGINIPSLPFSGDGLDLANNFLDPFYNVFYKDYIDNYSILKELSQQTVYGLKIQKTPPGGGYHLWHTENTTKHCAARLSAFNLYLNTIEGGGETEFLYYGLRVKPEQGTLVIWPAGFTHTHRGNPPLQETKYIITGWVESEVQ